jgi:hypothetical protein
MLLYITVTCDELTHFTPYIMYLKLAYTVNIEDAWKTLQASLCARGFGWYRIVSGCIFDEITQSDGENPLMIGT